MIQRFRFGLPLPTDSVVQEMPAEFRRAGALPHSRRRWLGLPDGSGWHRVRSGRNAPRHQQARLALRDQQHR